MATYKDYTGTALKPLAVEGPETGELNQDFIAAAETFAVPYDELDDFLRFAAGQPKVIGGTGGTISIPVPLQFSRLPALTAQRVTWRCEGAAGNDEAGDPKCGYKVAFVRVEYRSTPYPIFGPTAFMSITVAAGQTYMTLPTLAYKVNGKTPKEPPSRYIPTLEILITRFRMPLIDLTAFVAYAGKVNSTDFVFGPYTFAPGFILCGSPTATCEQDVLGQPLWTVTLPISYRDPGWQFGPDPDTGDFYQYVPKPYPEADLNALWAPVSVI